MAVTTSSGWVTHIKCEAFRRSTAAISISSRIFAGGSWTPAPSIASPKGNAQHSASSAPYLFLEGLVVRPT